MTAKKPIELALYERFQTNIQSFETSFNAFAPTFPNSRAWLERETGTSGSNVARQLLSGARLALLEAGAAWSVGSNRGAASSLRVFLENSMAWLFYKDHPVEFAVMENGHADLLLPKAIQTYLRGVDQGFEAALLFLTKAATRPSDYYYGEVSRYVHAHPSQAKAGSSAATLAISVPPDAGFLPMVGYADEFVSDYYASVWRKSWDDIPEVVQTNVSGRLGAKLRKFLEI